MPGESQFFPERTMTETCYIYWDDDDVEDRKVFVQCAVCHRENKKGLLWSNIVGYGDKTVKCDLCNRVIYKGRDGKK